MLRSGFRQLSQLRYGRRVAIGLCGALVIYSLAGFFLVPWIIDRQIRSQARARLNREAQVGGVRFNPFTLAATITGFSLADRDGDNLLTCDRLYVNFQLSGLFRRALRFSEIRVERPVVHARILPNGQPSVADLITTEPDRKDSGSFQLPRLIVDLLTIDAGLTEFSDASVQPPYQSRFEPLNVSIRNLITIPEESGEHTITIGVEDGAVLRWTGQQIVDPLRFAGRLDITGLSLKRLWDYFGNGQPIEIHNGRVDVSLPYEIRRGPDERIHMTLKGGSATVQALAARPRGQTVDWVSIPDLRVENVAAAWPEGQLDVGSIRAQRPRVLILTQQDGTLNWSNALNNAPTLKPASDAVSPKPPDLKWRIGSASIEGASIGFEDVFTAPPTKLEIAELAVTATGLSSDLAAPVPVTLHAGIPEKGVIDLSGELAPSPVAANLMITAGGIDLAPLRAYIANSTGLAVAGGTAGFAGQLSVSGEKPTVKLNAAATLDNVALQGTDGEKLITWRRLEIAGLTAENPPGRARIRKMTLDGPFAKILIDKSGRLNLTKLVSTPATPKSTASSTTPLRVEVGIVELRAASAEFQDESLLLPFRARIHSAAGAIRDLSSFAAAPAALAVEGRVDETGYVKSDGTLRLSDPMASSEVHVSFRSIEMSDLTPYFAQFAGYAVKHGVLDLDVKYIIKDRRLIGNHTLNARDLALGERVKDSKAPGLPIRLAVALLKDREGRINMDVPIEGAVDSPQFDYRAVFWTAVRTILGNAAKAPFRAIGRLFGRDEDDLELVEFDAGRSGLLPAEDEKLARFAEQIGLRKELTLEIEGRFDPVSDRAALQRSKLERLIETRRETAAAAAAATDAPTLETILEALFTDQFTAAALAAERQRFATGENETTTFDAAAFYESLRARLLESQQVTETELGALGTARAETIRTALTRSESIDPSRVVLAAPASAKRKKSGSARIASEITLSADDE